MEAGPENIQGKYAAYIIGIYFYWDKYIIC